MPLGDPSAVVPAAVPLGDPSAVVPAAVPLGDPSTAKPADPDPPRSTSPTDAVRWVKRAISVMGHLPEGVRRDRLRVDGVDKPVGEDQPRRSKGQ